MGSRVSRVAFLAWFLWAAVASAQPEAPITRDAASLSDAELDRRIDWLKETLDEGAPDARLYDRVWDGVYGTGLVVGTILASTTGDHDERVNHIVTASKGALGLSRNLLQPHPARRGGDPLREIQGEGREAQLRRLAAGEEQLLLVVKRAEERTDWRAHAGNVAINLIGGGIILGLGNPSDSAVSAVLGTAVGAVHIFWQPNRAPADLAEYERLFNGGPPKKTWNLELVPLARGAAIRVTF